MSPEAFKRQNELIQASIVYGLFHLEDFQKDMGVDFTREEMDQALKFYQKRKPFKKNKKKHIK